MSTSTKRFSPLRVGLMVVGIIAAIPLTVSLGILGAGAAGLFILLVAIADA